MLDALTVESIFFDCMFKEGEDNLTPVLAEGITCTVGFHAGRLQRHAIEIEELLNELPDDFKKEKGGGWSFLNACFDKHGHQWTGFHRVVEQLFQLGIAAGKAEYLFPKEIWEVLPGGMPYLIVK